ncbi:MAG TPA: 16S rRNA (adenine(1518)-N(6)/adenine(1519)-N(6))-dimethyltransferase RsmA [Acidobacteriaceae bacterium]|nr:16S rRNA (adenine(1518)-N(6)/adenine(1519)-N(6))-dimethyltransferase RsmA [Acidobacteriaceae bacterium]
MQPQRPKLGQNFLVNPTAQAAIADALGDMTHRTVVEIGPGRGAITAILASRAQRLIAIELDRDLAPRLRQQFADRPSVTILEQDILTTDLPSLREPGPGDDKLLVVGNLPYYITSDILLHLFAAHRYIERAVVMIQREVADRVAASPGTRDYGLLSATTQLYARAEKLFTLPPAAFSPPPQVHSTVLRLTMAPRFEELGLTPTAERPDPVADFIALLRVGFAQKRKMLAKNLRTAGYDAAAVTAAFESCGIPPQSRAEQIDLPAMACLFRRVSSR